MVRLEKTIAFIREICFGLRPAGIDDAITACGGCGKKGWLREDIEHTPKCPVGAVMGELAELDRRQDDIDLGSMLRKFTGKGFSVSRVGDEWHMHEPLIAAPLLRFDSVAAALEYARDEDSQKSEVNQ